MARIRTIKPEFFRDEKLQDIQAENPQLHPMLVFVGLWTVADKNGVFEWLPRTLKLDILPFLDYDLSASLALLERFSLISRFSHDGRDYGVVVNFTKHQRINGKEAVSESKFPNPSQGSIREAPEKQPESQEGKGIGKGREEERNGLNPVTEESFTLDAAVSYVLVEAGLAGKKIRDVVHEVIYREIKQVGVGPKDCAEAMIEAWRKYDKAMLSYKYGPENFFATGTWRKPESEWDRGEANGNGKRPAKLSFEERVTEELRIARQFSARANNSAS